jgi:hypothetical protein
MAMRRRHHSRRDLLRFHGDLRRRHQSARLRARLSRSFLRGLDRGSSHHHRDSGGERSICVGYLGRYCGFDTLPYLIHRIDCVSAASSTQSPAQTLTRICRYSVILSNRLAVTIAARVPPALIAAGLPPTSIASFIAAFPVGASAFEAVPGVTPQILAIGTSAYQQANADAYRTVFFSNIAFSGVAIICSLLLPDVDHLLTGQVAATLQKED